MSLLERTKLLLRSRRSLPKRAFGQNFMIEPSIYQFMVKYASLGRNDTVLDIGAGLGFLTRFMADKCKGVIAVEADTELGTILRRQLSHFFNVKVIEGSILRVNIPQFNKIVSTPPYSISSRLLLWILKRGFDSAVLVFQREFADRLAASVGNRNYGWLTVLTYFHAQVELLDNVPKSMFFPPPKVDSVITRLTPRRSRPIKLENEAALKKIVQMLFTQRNKKVRTAALPYLKHVRILSKEEACKVVETLPFRDKRVRDLAPEDFGALADVLIQ
jgi:16S rRNA (adenine1518-N6/adenine1519-N6)-dimethyltransferase